MPLMLHIRHHQPLHTHHLESHVLFHCLSPQLNQR
jgi:hypothetical protein